MMMELGQGQLERFLSCDNKQQTTPEARDQEGRRGLSATLSGGERQPNHNHRGSREMTETFTMCLNLDGEVQELKRVTRAFSLTRPESLQAIDSLHPFRREAGES